MTKYEKNEFEKWNIEITKSELEACEAARVIMAKYFKLNKMYLCNSERFIFEIATTTAVSEEERIADIRTYVDYLNKEAKGKALSDILHIYS